MHFSVVSFLAVSAMLMTSIVPTVNGKWMQARGNYGRMERRGRPFLGAIEARDNNARALNDAALRLRSLLDELILEAREAPKLTFVYEGSSVADTKFMTPEAKKSLETAVEKYFQGNHLAVPVVQGNTKSDKTYAVISSVTPTEVMVRFNTDGKSDGTILPVNRKLYQ